MKKTLRFVLASDCFSAVFIQLFDYLHSSFPSVASFLLQTQTSGLDPALLRAPGPGFQSCLGVVMDREGVLLPSAEDVYVRTSLQEELFSWPSDASDPALPFVGRLQLTSLVPDIWRRHSGTFEVSYTCLFPSVSG
ncbi:uncharacterized protein V6R79_003312 [Siganus canaliculatus]